VSETGQVLGILLQPLKHRALGAELHFGCSIASVMAALLVAQQALERPSLERALARSRGAGLASLDTQTPSTQCAPSRVLSDYQQHRLLRSPPPPRDDSSSGLDHACPRLAQTSLCSTQAHALPSAVQLSSACKSSPASMQRHPQDAAQAGAAQACAAAQHAVVRVIVGGSWASGIVVDASAGLIITNAHAIRSPVGAELASSVYVEWADPATSDAARWLARILWTSTQCHALDVAILRIHTQHGQATSSGRELSLREVGAADAQVVGDVKQRGSLDFSVRQPVRVGRCAMVVGHSLLGTAVSVPPSVTFGCVSAMKGVRSQRASRSDAQPPLEPALAITDAAVHAGCSGGGLFALHTSDASCGAEFLGLVTSNARHSRGMAVPTIGWILPVEQLAEIWQACKRYVVCECADERDGCFEGLDRPRPELDALWGLAAGQHAAQSKARAMLAWKGTTGPSLASKL
jgi:S1-C subfamily serine protease